MSWLSYQQWNDMPTLVFFYVLFSCHYFSWVSLWVTRVHRSCRHVNMSQSPQFLFSVRITARESQVAILVLPVLQTPRRVLVSGGQPIRRRFSVSHVALMRPTCSSETKGVRPPGPLALTKQPEVDKRGRKQIRGQLAFKGVFVVFWWASVVCTLNRKCRTGLYLMWIFGVCYQKQNPTINSTTISITDIWPITDKWASQ